MHLGAVVLLFFSKAVSAQLDSVATVYPKDLFEYSTFIPSHSALDQFLSDAIASGHTAVVRFIASHR